MGNEMEAGYLRGHQDGIEYSTLEVQALQRDPIVMAALPLHDLRIPRHHSSQGVGV